MQVIGTDGSSGEQSINPEAVAEIANLVSDTLADLNLDFDDFQSNVFKKLEEHWFNDNTAKVIPSAVERMKSISSGVNTSLESLGNSLKGATDTWAEANGSPGYAIKKTVGEIKNMVCNAVTKKNGFSGMDVDDVQEAISSANTCKENMIKRLDKLRQAGDTEGFRGGSMQTALDNVCDELKSSIENAFNNVIDDITTNTGIAKGNVQTATSTTESTFTIS